MDDEQREIVIGEVVTIKRNISSKKTERELQYFPVESTLSNYFSLEFTYIDSAFGNISPFQ